MQNSEQPPSDIRVKRKETIKWGKVFSILGLIITPVSILLAYIEVLVPSAWISWVRGTGVIILLIAFTWLLRVLFIRPYEWLHNWLNHFVPWFVVLGLILSLAIYLAVQPSQKVITIPLMRGNGAIYDSWDYQPQLNHYISASGEPNNQMWVIDQEGVAKFSYRINSDVQQNDPNASSGGYMSFYATPCDRLTYREVSFDSKATAISGQTTNSQFDVGVRLVVDDPNSTGSNREIVIYEVPSLKAYYRGQRQLDNNWQTFTLDLNNFTQKVVGRLPPPPGVDGNSINKIVFFISNDIVKNSPEGTLWFRDIKFKSGQR